MVYSVVKSKSEYQTKGSSESMNDNSHPKSVDDASRQASEPPVVGWDRKMLLRAGSAFLSVVLLLALTTGAVFAAGSANTDPTADAGLTLQYAGSARTPQTWAEVYAENVDSCVGVSTNLTTDIMGYEVEATGGGSGFIITEDGYILTNHHVIDGADSIVITTYDGATFDAELVGCDDTNDIAVLKIDAAGLNPVTFGDSSLR